MQISQTMAGYSLGQADLLRRAMGKKKPEEMQKQRSIFCDGAKKNGISESIAVRVFDQMETFALYGFNKSHSAAYALISYQTAYLKTHYPAHFMAALMSHELGDTDKTLKNMNECNRAGLTVLFPNINTQFANFSVDRKNNILFGLASIKGVGQKAVNDLVEERNKNGVFKGLFDFCKRVPEVLNKRLLENFIKAGAFDWTGVTRAELMLRADDAVRNAQQLQRDSRSSQLGLFAEIESDPDKEYRTTRKPEPEWPSNIKLAYEKESLGFYLSGHPLERFKAQLSRKGIKSIADIKSRSNGEVVTVAGVISMLKEKNTKKGDRYATFLLEDLEENIEVLVWPESYKKYSYIFTTDEPVTITAKLDVSDERVQLIANTIESIVELRNQITKEIVIRTNASKHKEEQFKHLPHILKQHQGSIPVKVLYCRDGHSETVIKLGEGMAVSGTQEFSNAVERLLGEHTVEFR